MKNKSLPMILSPKLRLAALGLTLIGACDDASDHAERSDELQGTESPEYSFADEISPTDIEPERIGTEKGFTLAGADEVPVDSVVRRGPLTLRYQGAHEYVAPKEAIVLDESGVQEGPDAPASLAARRFSGIRLIDSKGREWKVEDFDEREVHALGDVYREHMSEIRELGTPGAHTNWGDVDDFAASITPQAASNWTVFECTKEDDGFDSSKWRYNNGTHEDLDAMNVSQKHPLLDMNNTGFNGTAVLIDNELALTAGHVANALVSGDQLCRITSTGTQCRSVDEVLVSGDGGGNDDWGLVKFTSPFTGDWNFMLSDDSDSRIKDFTPRIAAFPTLERGREAICGASSLLEGERNKGTYHSLKTKEARLNITAGGGSSGAPYYFYSNGEYWIFGIHSYRGRTWGDRYSAGPKVPYWIDEIVAGASALGVDL